MYKIMENFIKEMLRQSIEKAVNSIGLEGTLEAIEHIRPEKLRDNLRQAYFEYIKKRK